MNLNMLLTLKPYSCPSCNFPYSSKDAGKFHVNKFPHILPCCHSICEHCLHKCIKERGSVCCSLCKEIAVGGGEHSSSNFMPDIHALGILSANVKNALPSLKVKMVPANSRYQPQEPKKLINSIICGHCDKSQALWQCDKCQLNFCSSCFDKVHSDMKLKKKHEGKKIFAEQYSSMVQEGCSIHDNRPIEFYCEADNQLTCSYCMLMGDHVGHEVKTLMDKNKSCTQDLKESLDNLTDLHHHLKYTDHLLCEAIPKEKVDISDKIKDVHDHFHKLHAVLQMREKEIISDLTESSLKHIKPLEEMRSLIASYERDLIAIKRDAEAVMENPCLAFSAPAIVKKMGEMKNTPCYFFPLDSTDNEEIHISVEMNSELEERIKTFGSVDCNIKSKCSLLRKEELPEDYISTIPDSFLSKLQGASDVESCSTNVDTFSEDSLLVKSEKSNHDLGIKASYKCRDFARMHPEQVMVSHVNTPTNFFIQKISDLKKIKNMFDALNRWCKTTDSKRYIPVSVEKGDLYLVKFKADNIWYRARVKNIIDPEESEESVGKVSPVKDSEGKITVKSRNCNVEVIYIDYGNTDRVSISDMRMMQNRFLNFPGIAKCCSLLEINPANKENWCSESLEAFTEFVHGKVLIMQVYEERNDVLYIDLSQSPDHEVSNDCLASVRDALVFLELAVFDSGRTFSKKRKKNERNYMPPEPLCVNIQIPAIVSHVDNPSNIYVQQLSTSSYLSKLVFEMNEEYNDSKNSILHSVNVPHVGMMCAAQFSLDKQWYRALVIDLPGGANVEVKYVDFGNQEIIHHKYLRKLFDRFTKLNIQAIPCKLAHVSYNQKNRWTDEDKKWLTNQISSKHMTLKSLGTIPGENKADIVLYYADSKHDVCVNALMVEEGLAVSTGEFSITVRTEKPVSSLVPPLELSSLVHSIVENIPPPKPPASVFIAPAEDPISPPRPKHDSMPRNCTRKTLVTPPKLHKTPPKTANAAETKFSPNYPTLAKPPPDPKKNQIEVHVSHIESPSVFYIRIAKDHENRLNVLMESMQATYLNLEEVIEDCKVDKAYAVYSTKFKKWFRGNVVAKLSEDNLKIFFVDYGYTEEIEKRNLRKLLDKFSKDESFSVRCHLEGLTPAGGNKWSQTCLDTFRQMIEPHDVVLLSSQGEVDKENRSLPSDLLIENIIKGGALTPTIIKLISITDELVDKGLAIRMRRKRDSASKVSVPKFEDISPESKVEVIKENGHSDTPSIEPELSPVLQSKDSPKSENETLKPEEIQSQEYQLEVQSSSQLQPEIEPLPPPREPKYKWGLAVCPEDTKFRGFVTNISEDGCIQFYVLKEGSSQIEIIAKAIQFKCNKNPYKKLEVSPPVGEACIAKFSVDNQWYRAEIVSIYPDKVKVHFVDYGNHEIVPLSDVHPDVIMLNFPRQCIECGLFELKDINIHWDNDLTTFLHNQIVETEVNFEVKIPSDGNNKLYCTVTTVSGINIADLLLNMGFVDDSPSAATAESNPDSEMKSFTRASELHEGDVFPVCITQSNENIVYLQLLKIPKPKTENEEKHNSQVEAFLQMISDLQANADNFPVLKDPMPGMTCCGKFDYDNNWYRCEIIDLTPTGAVVLYVDYGNSETVLYENLRELSDWYIDFPLQLHFCELDGVRPSEGEWTADLNKQLVECLMTTDRDFFAKVILPGKISKVDIFVKDEDSYKLAYDELRKKNLIVVEKP